MPNINPKIRLNDLSNPIQRLRAFAGLTQGELAQLLDAAQSTVAQWETGVRRPARRYLKRLKALALQVRCRLSETEIYSWRASPTRKRRRASTRAST